MRASVSKLQGSLKDLSEKKNEKVIDAAMEVLNDFLTAFTTFAEAQQTLALIETKRRVEGK